MSEDKDSASLGRDALGIALFGIAAFTAISVVMSAFDPASEPTGTTAVVTAIVAAIGTVPALALCAGLGWFGGRLWLSGVRPGALRVLVGLALVTLALSVLAGAIRTGAGGALGALTGEAVSSQMTRLVGVPFGLVSVAVPIWFLWLRPRAHFSEISGERDATLAVGPTESEGVSAAEAEALLPDPAARQAERKSQKAAELQQALETSARQRPTSPATPLPPLYPPDVRLTGGIPEGAQPLARTHEPTANPGATQPSSVQRRGAEGAAVSGQRPGADLAAQVRTGAAAPGVAERAGSLGGPVAGVAAAGPTARTEAERLIVDAPARATATGAPSAATSAPSAATSAPSIVRIAPPAPEPTLAESSAAATDRDARIEVRPIESAPAAPSWEEGGLFAETVDAYGTPLSLVDSLRRANAETAELLDGARADEDDEESAVIAGDPALEERALADVTPPTELDDASSEETEDEVEVEEVDELDEDSEVDADDADVEVDEDEDLDGDETRDDDGVHALGDEDEELLDDEQEPEFELDVASAAEDEDESIPDESKVAATTERALADFAAGSDEELALDAPSRNALPFDATAEEPIPLPGAGARAAVVQAELAFTAPEASAGEEATTADAEPRAPAERTVVLAPRAAPAAQAADAPAEVGGDDMVFRAGCLILERKRVAVSLLQREYGLDFKAATDLLDQLQEAGLIGPYLGGQRRDILLTPEQWRERVGAV